jgi:hypothetical protein
MDLAADAEGPVFAAAAYMAIKQVAMRKPEVHVDDVLTCCTIRPHHFNAWGQVWMRAIRDGLIVHSGRVRQCVSDPAKHAHQYPIYRSLIYRDTTAWLAALIDPK